MAQKKQPFADTHTKTASTGSNDVATERVDPGWLWCVQHTTVENETTAYTSLRLLIAGQGEDVQLVEELGPQADTLYWHDDPIYLGERQQLIARCAGCTSGDVLKLHVTGWKARTPFIDGAEEA